MNLMTIGRHALSAAIPVVAICGGVAVSAPRAWAPQMVANELAAQRALGYEPCEPILTQLPAEIAEVAYADAAPSVMFQVCEIRFASDMPAEALEWVPWHEVCHLSTLAQIWDDPHRDIVDPAHNHPLFQACIAQGPAETGGYLHEH